MLALVATDWMLQSPLSVSPLGSVLVKPVVPGSPLAPFSPFVPLAPAGP